MTAELGRLTGVYVATPRMPDPAAERWHAHPYAVAAGRVAGLVLLVAMLLVAGILRWRSRREERDFLRKYRSRGTHR